MRLHAVAVLALLVATPARALEAPADTLPFALTLGDVVAVRGDALGQVMEPAGLALDAFGQVWVADAALHRLQRLDPQRGRGEETGILGSGQGDLRRPSAVTPLGASEMAVLDVGNRRIVTYDLFGRRLDTRVDLAALEDADPSWRVDPVAMAADRGGAIVLADADRERLVVFDFTGRPLRVLGGPGPKPGSFRGLRGLALAARGEMVVAERVNARLQRLDAGGRPVRSWALPVRAGAGALPVACDDGGRIAVADEDVGRLWIFDGEGRLLATRGGLQGPRALAFDRDGSLLVAEAGAGRVLRLRIERRPAPVEP